MNAGLNLVSHRCGRLRSFRRRHLGSGFKADQLEKMLAWIQCFDLRFRKIYDTAIWGAPIELFCEIAMTDRNHSPFAKTFFFGYSNGWLGYLPTKAWFAEGGYEPGTSPFSDRAEQDITETAIGFLQSMPR